MKYNYVYFDTGSIKNRKNDRDNYFYICTEELRNYENIRVVSYPMDWAPFIFHQIQTVQKIFRIPFPQIWYPMYFKYNFPDRNRPLCFIISGYYITPHYLQYLRKKYASAKFVLIHRDLISLWHKRNPLFTRETVNKLFDIEMSFDKIEAAQYNIPFFSEIESKTDVTYSSNYPLSDLFFAGAAKNRLPILLQIYEEATKRGIKCDFYLTGVEKNQRINRKGIFYAEKNMSYREMLYRTVNSNCILEVNQSNAVGYTSRFLEAVMYNKKLITNNNSIKEDKFYRKEYIKCFEKVDDIDYSFITKKMGVIDYNYNNEFSPIHLVEQIEELLNRNNGK